MERGVYFDAWYPRQHCYHPSLPPRRLRMVEDLVDYKATMLVWSALGGGSVSLPYLEEEAFQKIDPRFRFYGFVNDAEFIRACDENGIKVFGIVFEVQGWEFPVELSDAEDEILSLNELRGAGKRDWLGLREFNQDRYPKLWKSWRDYFPDGIRNSDGEDVTDILEEAVSRDIHGNPCHSDWVEAPDRDHYCYLMDRNNPAWREYLKGIIRIQIDAGVHGVQLDEADLPYFSTRYGGCFCKDCMKQFRAYLQRLPEPPAELEGVDLESFHYGEWLLAQGYDFKTRQEETPLFWTYKRWQREEIVPYFAELADYAREYGRSKGREVLVSGNLYYLSPHYYPFEPHCDVLITEMDSTGFRQPEWSRYAACFAGDKPVIVVENPYGGVIPALVEELHDGKGYDLYRTTMYEAAALGINMTVPYGSWLGSVIEDSFWAPHDVTLEIQRFLADNERLFARPTHSDTALVFSIESNFELVERSGNQDFTRELPFWQASRAMVRGGQPYDVVMFPEGKLRADTITSEELLRYRTLVLPECRYLTGQQVEALTGYLDGGGRAVVVGDLGLNLPDDQRTSLSGHANVTVVASGGDFTVDALPLGPQMSWEGDRPDLAVNIQRTDEGAAVHIIRYDYDEERDEVPVLPQLAFEIRLDQAVKGAEAFSPSGPVKSMMEKRNDRIRVVLRNVPLYTVVMLES